MAEDADKEIKTCGTCKHYRRKIQRCSRNPNVNFIRLIDDVPKQTYANMFCQWKPLYQTDRQTFDLKKEVNDRNFSLTQRKFLRRLGENFIGTASLELLISNLSCDEIEAVINLFGKDLMNTMIC